ncbi:MAG: putative sugar nucleotidyl transferase [Patescibacteria group bacterium]
MKIILYEDNQASNLYPITLTRPSFDIFCGAANLVQVIKTIFSQAGVGYLVRDHLKEIVAKKYPAKEADTGYVLYLNGSLIPSFTLAKKLAETIRFDQELILKNGEKIIGAIVAANQPITNYNELEAYSKKLDLKMIQVQWPSFNYSWEVIVYNQQIINDNLDYLKINFKEIKPNVFVGGGVKLADNISFNTDNGIIIIDEKTKISPFVYLAGPLYIGSNCLIKEFAAVKDKCCIGPVCKIGGEIEATIIQGYSNKQHYGFLGHSYLGEWVNIAAGTSNSDLKNTYSLIKIGGVETGQQFLGTVIGDYSKTAINTSIFTGRIIGACSFVYGTITRDIISFTNYAANLGCVIELDFDVAIKSQKAMFGRRQMEQTAVEINLLKNIYELTAADRLAANVKPGRLEFKI